MKLILARIVWVKGEALRDPGSQMNQKLASPGLFASTNMKDMAVQLFPHCPLE